MNRRDRRAAKAIAQKNKATDRKIAVRDLTQACKAGVKLGILHESKPGVFSMDKTALAYYMDNWKAEEKVNPLYDEWAEYFTFSALVATELSRK